MCQTVIGRSVFCFAQILKTSLDVQWIEVLIITRVYWNYIEKHLTIIIEIYWAFLFCILLVSASIHYNIKTLDELMPGYNTSLFSVKILATWISTFLSCQFWWVGEYEISRSMLKIAITILQIGRLSRCFICPCSNVRVLFDCLFSQSHTWKQKYGTSEIEVAGIILRIISSAVSNIIRLHVSNNWIVSFRE